MDAVCAADLGHRDHIPRPKRVTLVVGTVVAGTVFESWVDLVERRITKYEELEAGMQRSQYSSSSQPLCSQSENLPRSSQRATSSAIATPTGPYRLDFGRHIGKTLAECPPRYVKWLGDDNIEEQQLGLGVALKRYRDKKAAEAKIVKTKGNLCRRFRTRTRFGKIFR